MKKITLLFLSLVLFLLMSGCHISQDNKGNSDKTPESSDGAEISFDWKKAYRDFLIKQKGDYQTSKFYLACVDTDNIPEIFISQDASHIATVAVYQYLDEEITLLKEGGNLGQCEFAFKGSMIVFDGYTNGSASKSGNLETWKRYYSLKKGKLTDEGFFRCQNGEYGDSGWTYNDQSVSENEFQQKMEALEKDKNMQTVSYADNMIEITEKNIDEELKNWD